MQYIYTRMSMNKIMNEIINKVIQTEFPKLNIKHRNKLLELMIDILDLVSIKFGIGSDFNYQLQQNDNQDIKGFLLMLIPFVNDKSEIKDLNDIYVSKEPTDTDINKAEPKYVFSNVQYGRCKRGKTNTEIPFDIEHLNHNFYLLKETIQTVANKLYVNWIDIRPIPVVNIQDNEIIKNYPRIMNILNQTTNAFENNNLLIYDPVIEDKQARNYGGIYIGDIYDVLANNLYFNIKSIKWLIYDGFNNNNELQPFYYYIHNILLQGDFLQNWNDLKVSSINEVPFINKSVSIPPKTVRLIVKSIIYFFDKWYMRNKDILDTGYIPLDLKGLSPGEIDLEDDEETLSRSDKFDNILFKTLPTMKPERVQEFINESFERFKNTWYGAILKDYNTVVEFDNNITAKNIYSFAKSLSSYKQDKSYIQYPRYWKTLNDTDKKEIQKRLNWNVKTDGNVKKWFTITRYIRYTYKLQNDADINARNTEYFINIKKIMPKIILNIMTLNGILSEFVPSKELTDAKINKNNVSQSLDNLIKNTSDKARWDNSVYFLTGKKYSDHKMTYEESSGISQTKSYLDLVSESNKKSSRPWYTLYAMDWVAQIGFFHKYLNNRILFVTGGTGAGKTTQVPKLLLYAMKAFDYNNDGKIICTQPRQSLVETNTETIALQLGVPITEYNSSVKKNVRTNNYHLQYKHGANSHEKEKQTGLLLKFSTDRILFDILRENPLLIKYISNIYDIVIVDEAHEHNENMDLILTLMRYATYYNNSIKFVIMSATMESDEHIYRRYYRNVNDNRMFPFNDLLQKHNLDRINVDRRIHLSSPSIPKYTVTDIYEPKSTPEELILRLAKTTKTGDILLFQPGQAEIEESLKVLNKKLPSNFIALPLYSSLSQEKRKFITGIKEGTILKYQLPRDIPFDSSYDESTIKKVPVGTYTRVVIITTNLAEASLTIPTLRYIVDTGTERTNVYDYQVRTSNLKLGPIPEASRVQRRGRAGRVESGEAYYIYEKGDKENIRKKFKISVIDIHEILYDLLRDNDNENDNISYISNDPNNVNNFNKVFSDQMIKYLYYNKNEFMKYIGNNKHYDYENNEMPPVRYETGYSKETLTDNDGTFYIIHPEELYLKRNITGKIIGLTPDVKDNTDIAYKNNKIESKKMATFWDILEETRLVQNGRKTIYGKQLLEFRSESKLKNPLETFIVLLYSRKYNLFKEIILLLPLLEVLNGRLENLSYTVSTKYNTRVSQLSKLQDIYGTCISDTCSLLSIINNILTGIGNLSTDLSRMINRILTDKVTINEEIEMIEIKQKYLKGKETNNYAGINTATLDKLLKLDYSNKLQSNNKLNDIEKKELVDEIDTSVLNDNSEKIKRWCFTNYLNYDTVTDYIKTLGKLINQLGNYNYTKFEYFDKNISNVKITDNKCENMTRVFLSAYPSNIVKKIDGTDLYTPLLNPSPIYIYSLNNVTLMKKYCYPDYILYIGTADYERNMLSIIHKIDPITIQQIVPFVYPPEKFQKSVYDMKLQEKSIEYLLSSMYSDYDKRQKQKKLAYNIIGNYLRTIQKIRQDMINNYEHANNKPQTGGTQEQATGRIINYKNYTNAYIEYILNEMYRN